MHGSFRHRPEIDGLRALAVIPVILFHAGFDWFSGGFVGVDVFFVISGYLITSILITERQAGRFSVLSFYERRARRILPALFLVMLACLPVAWLWMTPLQLESFSQSLMAVPVFGSNFLFWRITGYFDSDAEEHPLLHTWSLGVEEQYYILFPVILLLLWRLGSKRLVWLIALMAVISLWLSQWLLGVGFEDSSFFLAPPRAWELLIGSMLALVMGQQSPAVQVRTGFANALAVVGLALIIVSVAVYEQSTQFPGVRALLPTVGTALVIGFGREQTLVARLLSIKWIVGIGLISYSAYLWHQPLFAFARIYTREPPSELVFGGLAVLSLGLAYLSWQFVELPFRNRAKFTRTQIFASSAAASILLLAVGAAGHFSSGFETAYKGRLAPDDLELSRRIDEAVATGGYAALVDNGDCKFSHRAVSEQFRSRFSDCVRKYGRATLVLGDSHAIDLFNAMASTSSAPFVASISMHACRPYPSSSRCQYEDFLRFVRDHAASIRTIFYTQSGEYLLTDPAGREVGETTIKGTYEYLRRLSRLASTVWVGPQPELIVDLRSNNLLRRKTNFGFKEGIFAVDRFLSNYNMVDVAYVSKIAATNFTPDDLFLDGKFTYSDRDHWSSYGEKVFGQRLLTHELVAAALGGAGGASPIQSAGE